MKGFSNSQIKHTTCIACGKPYRVFMMSKGTSKHRLLRRPGQDKIRRYGCVTCSPLCSRLWNRARVRATEKAIESAKIETAEKILKLADEYHEENYVEFKHEGFKDLVKQEFLNRPQTQETFKGGLSGSRQGAIVTSPDNLRSQKSADTIQGCENKRLSEVSNRIKELKKIYGLSNKGGDKQLVSKQVKRDFNFGIHIKSPGRRARAFWEINSLMQERAFLIGRITMAKNIPYKNHVAGKETDEALARKDYDNMRSLPVVGSERSSDPARICTICEDSFEDPTTRHETCRPCRKKAEKDFKQSSEPAVCKCGHIKWEHIEKNIAGRCHYNNDSCACEKFEVKA